MKLRNKKTGDVIEVEIIARNDKYLIDRVIDTIYDNEPTLKGLSDEWEDYEEPKEYYWFIDDAGVVSIDKTLCSEINMRKSIGNYFNTREDGSERLFRASNRLYRRWWGWARLSFQNGWNLCQMVLTKGMLLEA